jgi:hypothetical protein
MFSKANGGMIAQERHSTETSFVFACTKRWENTGRYWLYPFCLVPGRGAVQKADAETIGLFTLLQSKEYSK